MQSKPGQIDELTRQSGFIIQGTVEQLKASTLSAIPPTERIAIVRVDAVYHAPPAFARYTGQLITVELQEPKEFSPGKQAVFFTTGWMYGASLAVREVGHLVNEVTPPILDQVRAALERLANEQQRQRLATADLVVVGTVVSTRPAKGVALVSLNFHSPKWWEAEVVVETVEKGTLESDSLIVVFPKSRDVFWYHAPKLTADQEGVFILRTQQLEGFDQAVYTALDPLDVHPKQRLEYIKRLLSASD